MTGVEQKKLKQVLVLMNFSGSFPSRLKEVEEIWPELDVEMKKLEETLVLMNFSGSIPSRLMISGRIRLLALMNQLRTCFVVSSVFIARISVSARVGYELYLCWKSHSRKTI